MVGGPSPSYSTGYKNILEIVVETESPVKIIIFEGVCPVRSGDTIEAYIPKAEEKVRITDGCCPSLGFVDRDFTEKESALYIKILENRKIVRTDHSIHYKK